MVLEGRKQAKNQTKNNQIYHFYIHRMCYTSSMHLPGAHRIHAGPTWLGFTNHVILFSVRWGRRVNTFLIWCPWGWPQELIESWSGAPEPKVLKGIKVPPPAGLLSLNRYVCTCQAHTPGKCDRKKLISSSTHALELCIKSWAGLDRGWSANKKRKRRDLADERNSVYLWDANFLARYWPVAVKWKVIRKWSSWKGANC